MKPIPKSRRLQVIEGSFLSSPKLLHDFSLPQQATE